MSVVILPSYEAIINARLTVVNGGTIMNVKSILEDIGNGFKKFFTGAEKVAVAAEPFIDIAFPGIASLYNTTVAAVGAAENAAIAAGAQNATGTQKLSMVTSSIEGSFNAYWASLGHKTNPTQTDIETYINAVVATLNAIPASSATSTS